MGDDPEQSAKEAKEASEIWEKISDLNREAIRAESNLARKKTTERMG